jgi:phosphoglycolate phosphatase
MTYAVLVFDLDGTLSDPKEGIVYATNYALTALGYDPVREDDVDKFIGPPLDDAFREITGLGNNDEISALIATYREAYAHRGYALNAMYPGIPDVLATLSECVARLAVCTSKRVDFAESILKLHGIRHYFEFVDGGDVGIQKWQQLQALLAKGTLTKNAIMIGDRYVDLTAAHRNGLASAGVLWGYGSLQELQRENPTHLLTRPQQLLELARP